MAVSLISSDGLSEFSAKLDLLHRKALTLSWAVPPVLQSHDAACARFGVDVWKTTDVTNTNAVQDDGGAEVHACAVCGQRHTTTMCGASRKLLCRMYWPTQLYFEHHISAAI